MIVATFLTFTLKVNNSNLFAKCTTTVKLKMATVLSVIVCVYYLLVAIEGDHNVYFVDPNKATDKCPGNNNCSLMYYATHPGKFFSKNNTAFCFLPGDHQLFNSTRVNWANVSNLTVHGVSNTEMTARVMCKGEQTGGFLFYNITNLTIGNLNFFNCSVEPWKYRGLVAVEIDETYNLTMYNVTIQETSGYGLSMTDIYGDSIITNITIDSSHNTTWTNGGNFAYYCSKNFTSTPSQHHSLHVSKSFFRYGHNFFDYKSTASGIFLQVECSVNFRIVFDSVTATGNKAYSGGNVWIEYSINTTLWSVIIIFQNSELSHGFANNVGGGLYMIAVAGCTNCTSHSKNSSTILTIENTHFENNSASYDGGAVYFRLHQNPLVAVAKIEFKNVHFNNNSLVFNAENYNAHGGVGVHIITYTLPEYEQHKTVFFEVSFSNCKFENNYVQNMKDSVPRTGALFMEYARNITIENSKFVNNRCTGVVALGSNLLLHGKNMIYNNTGVKGGGMFFCAGGLMHLYNGSELNITRNSASLSGGGIYVDNECSPAVSYCFFQVDNVTADIATLQHTKVHLNNNTASAGTAIYGGLIDDCVLFDKHGQNYSHHLPSKIFNFTFHPNHKNNDLSFISSDPIYVGFCTINSSTVELSQDNCPLNTSIENVMPGSLITVRAVIMGQRYGLVSGLVVAWYQCSNRNCKVDKEHYSQYVNATTNGTDLTYTINPADERNVTLVLVAEDYYSGFPSYTYNPSHIHITIADCPLGFIKKKHNGQYSCSCIEDIACNITERTLYRMKPHWIGYMQDYYNNTTDVIYHNFCPLAYCLDKDVTINTTLNGTTLNELFGQDAQCSVYRTGLLCGACKTGYSLGFGSSQCLPHCDTRDIAIRYVRVIGLIVVCAVAGIMLVVLLTLLNLTVAEGTLNGLIFYANIVQVNLDIFFPSETHARPWTAFIAWLNLDFGFTVCFYDGMDAYAKTWLQFIFPLYIWLISGGIIYFSWKYNKVAQLTGKNAVKVLATLFLLSFGKLLRTVITAILYTKVCSLNELFINYVWLLDANVHYLHGKHVILFITSLLVGLVVVLYALILTSIQCLRRAPNNRMCGWVLRLKPLLDAYTGPYKDKYQFWTGLLLLVRIFLFSSFALNYENDPTVNFTLIICVCAILIAIQPGIYRHQFVGLLESSMYVNLILFSVIMMFSVSSYSKYKTIAAYVFGGWALLTFLGVIIFHAYNNWFGNDSCCQIQLFIKEKLSQCVHRRRTSIPPLLITREVINECEESDELEVSEREMNSPAWNTPHLREPLIGSPR